MGICVEMDAVRKQGQFECLNIYLGDRSISVQIC